MLGQPDGKCEFSDPADDSNDEAASHGTVTGKKGCKVFCTDLGHCKAVVLSGTSFLEEDEEPPNENPKKLPECGENVDNSQSSIYTTPGVGDNSTMFINCKHRGSCNTFPAFPGEKEWCEFSDPCYDSTDPMRGQGTITAATGGTVKGANCYLRCYGSCVVEKKKKAEGTSFLEDEESPSEDYALDSFDMTTKE